MNFIEIKGSTDEKIQDLENLKISNEKFEKGLDIGGYVTAPAKIIIISEDLVKNSYISTVEITIHEGKNRQIRRMCSSLNHEVISLKRVSIGELKLGYLQKGKYRELTKEEVQYIKEL